MHFLCDEFGNVRGFFYVYMVDIFHTCRILMSVHSNILSQFQIVSNHVSEQHINSSKLRYKMQLPTYVLRMTKLN